MTIDAVIKKQTEALMNEIGRFFVTGPQAEKLVLDTVNEVLESIKEEQLNWVNGLIEEGKKKK